MFQARFNNKGSRAGTGKQAKLFRFAIQLYKVLIERLGIFMGSFEVRCLAIDLFRSWYDNGDHSIDHRTLCVILCVFAVSLERLGMSLPLLTIMKVAEQFIDLQCSKIVRSLFLRTRAQTHLFGDPADMLTTVKDLNAQITALAANSYTLLPNLINEFLKWNENLHPIVVGFLGKELHRIGQQLLNGLLDSPVFSDFNPMYIALAVLARSFELCGFALPQGYFPDSVYNTKLGQGSWSGQNNRAIRSALTSIRCGYVDLSESPLVGVSLSFDPPGPRPKTADPITFAAPIETVDAATVSFRGGGSISAPPIDDFTLSLPPSDSPPPPPNDDFTLSLPPSDSPPPPRDDSVLSIQSVLTRSAEGDLPEAPGPDSIPCEEDYPEGSKEDPRFRRALPLDYQASLDDPPLIRAIGVCDRRAVERLLEEDAEANPVDAENSKGETGLLLAVLCFNELFYHHQNPVFQLVREQFRDIARTLLQHGANPFHKSRDGMYASWAASVFREQWIDVVFLFRRLPFPVRLMQFSALVADSDYGTNNPKVLSCTIPHTSYDKSFYDCGSHSLSFYPPSDKAMTIERICGWLVHHDFFTCTHSHAPDDPSHLIFKVTCGYCGPSHGHFMIKGDIGANCFTVRAQAVCPHFFAARSSDSGENGRSFTVFTQPPVLLKPSIKVPNDHPLRVIAGEVCNSSAASDPLKSYLKPWALGRSATAAHERDERGPHTLEELLERIGGHVFIETFKNLKAVPAGILFFDGKHVETFVWIADWAPAAFKLCSYVELDCSFKCGRPFVICIPMAVINNFGVPLGYILTPTERSESYQLFAECLAKVDAHCNVKDKPLLSDGGLGLANYGTKYCKVHYRCYRHLLEDLGSKTYVAMIAHNLLFCFSEEQFQKELKQATRSFQRGINENLITQKAIDLFCSLFGFTVRKGIVTLTRPDAFKEQALWSDRGMLYGVGACSNHSEGTHHWANDVTGSEQSLVYRAYYLFCLLSRKVISFPTQLYSSGWGHILRLKKMAVSLFERRAENAKDIWHGDTCPLSAPCPECKVFARRYGIEDFPCVHCALKWRRQGLPEPPTLDAPTVGIEQPADVECRESPRKDAWAFPVNLTPDAEEKPEPLSPFPDPIGEVPCDDEFEAWLKNLYLGLKRVGAEVPTSSHTLAREFGLLQWEMRIKSDEDLELRAAFMANCYIKYKNHRKPASNPTPQESHTGSA
jgi:hypothetical protein